ncbi:MAG: dTMP kinase [Myxococcales bacterium]|nr:dTMP kinase [Myxococcales bacterium]MDH3483948.1 dTMP kinase [Myxococcales bacterium]
MIEGQFIVIEGIDGSGTTTQCVRLGDRLTAKGLPVHITREPSDGPVGMLIRQVLTGRIVVPGHHGAHPSSWATMAALFAADRLDHLEAEIVPNLSDGVSIICDRYDYSSVAYQTVSSGGGANAARWVRELNRQARRPDLALVLDVRPEVAAGRRGSRSGSPELYETDAMQAELAAFYSTIDELFPDDRIRHIDANHDIEGVAEAIWAEVAALRGESP